MVNENLPAHVATSMTEIGSITYASEVVAIIAGIAAAEIDGVAAMGTAASIVDLLGRKTKPVTRGVKVEVGSEEASVDLVFTVEYGKPIQKVCRDVQESVRKSIETMTGLHVVKVDVHVMGVSFEKETQLSADLAQAANAAVDPGRTASMISGASSPTGPLGQIVRSRPLPRKDPNEAQPNHPEGADEDVDLPETAIDMTGDDADDVNVPAVLEFDINADASAEGAKTAESADDADGVNAEDPPDAEPNHQAEEDKPYGGAHPHNPEGILSYAASDEAGVIKSDGGGDDEAILADGTL
ncbi:MAG: Asp23/Gls24 family envelope stress response protein [Oscillospiraceae bacterium]|jgi:uncharacterized alkaline shock family protein YloU|nr:Asp23/Gls24 family envelope stress response protein [Oscillospiraceae bacterium]